MNLITLCRKAPLTLAVAATGCALLASPAHATTTLTMIGASSWGASDSALGLRANAVIEDFEDVALAPGLQVSVSNSSTGSYGPTSTLPRTFDPRPTSLGGDDAFGSAFYNYPCGTSACSSVWDGSHALINTGTNSSANYSTTTWGNVTLNFSSGVNQVGFSLHQNEFALNVYVNGAFFGSLPGGGGGRTGYFRFDVIDSGPTINSIYIVGGAGDAWVIDHLAFAPAVPEPGTWALALAGAAVVAGLARRRSAR